MTGTALRRFATLALLLGLAACSSGQRAGPSPPVLSSAAVPGAVAQGYRVQPGDTIYSVARQLNLSLRALIDANHLAAPYLLAPGQLLQLPGHGFYLVGKGDTLSVIARKTGVPFATLARINGLAPPFLLKIGQKLQLPAASASAPPLATAARPATAAPIAKSAVTAAGPAPPAASSAPPSGPPASPPPPPPSSQAVEAAALSLPPPPVKSARGFIWPVKGDVLVEFGTTGKGQHSDGINIAAARGTPVVAAESGVVAYAGNELRGFGNLLLIKHDEGWMTAYAHADQLLVRRGDLVKRGQKVATVGDSGGVTPTQLHFELRQGTRAIDPLPVLNGKVMPAGALSDPPDPG